MKLVDNLFNGIREIKGFTKDELLEIKRNLTKFKSEKSDQNEINDFLKGKFSSEAIDLYTSYINEIKDFVEQFLSLKEDSKNKSSFVFQDLKTGILDEIKLISSNLLNSKLNGRNIKRFLKNNDLLNNHLALVQNLFDEVGNLITIIENSIDKVGGIYDHINYIWCEINKIKNLPFKFKELPNFLYTFDEFKELRNFIENADINASKKQKRKKKDKTFITNFNEIYKFYDKNQGDKIKIYQDLIVLLYDINSIEELESSDEEFGEFINVLDRKDIIRKLKAFLNPIFKKLIEDKLESIFREILELDNSFKLDDEKQKVNLENLLNQKISILLPKISDYYLNGLEKKYQAILNDLKEYDEFKNISTFYTEKINIFYSFIEEIDNAVANLEPLLIPYEEITNSLRKIFDNVFTEIIRRKDEYTFYLKTIRKERLRDSVRNFIYEKISEINELMEGYQDETSLIVREEFPQLKQLREILKDYKVKIQNIKDIVYQKVDKFKEKDIDIYQIIKQWEDNFTLKKQQLGFLLSMILSKLFKNFKDMIEEEELLFRSLTEITDQKESIDTVPLNFALSNFLVDKLTEEELNERIAAVKIKVENLSDEINLYRSELNNFERTLSEKVKVREGISSDKIKCGVCHKGFDFAKDQLIKCPFCEALYHYLCVAFWLSKYNSCPACQNTFLDPNAGLYEDQKEIKE